jgi:Zn-dependent protease with chaperone function
VKSPIVAATVLLVGCLLILSLLKPLVARPAATSEPHYLNPEKQPLLFALVRSLASNIGVTAPDRIAVDCNVNCYCMFTGGIPGVFRSGFVLVIGLPLVAGLGLDQVVGVVAHELGHALQITTMRSSRFIWIVHSWLSRVASHQDEFDLMLQRRLDTAGNAMRPALRLIRLLVQQGRGILWLLMILEGSVTSTFRRRIEITADRYQIRVSGTERFVFAVLEINVLAVAAQRAMVEISRMKRRGQLIDDYPGLIAYIRSHYSEDFVQRLLAGLTEEKTGILSAHPCDNDRIALARAEHQRGIVTADLPASVLFAEYQSLCCELTVEYFEHELGVAAGGYEVVPIETILND